jgi:hypothetical protein
MDLVRASARLVLAVGVGLLLPFSIACSPEQGDPTLAADRAGQAADADELAGRIAGEEITAGEIDAWIMGKLFDNATGNRNPTRVFEIRKRALEVLLSVLLVRFVPVWPHPENWHDAFSSRRQT